VGKHSSAVRPAPTLLRPLVLFADQTVQQRAQETHTHPDAVRILRRRFRQQEMLGLLPANVEMVIRTRAGGIPDAVRREIDRLKTLYDGFHYRELARILSYTFGAPFDEGVSELLIPCQMRSPNA
jgi:hypothetical protein